MMCVSTTTFLGLQAEWRVAATEVIVVGDSCALLTWLVFLIQETYRVALQHKST